MNYKHITTLILIPIFTFPVISQEFDEAFIGSLPGDVAIELQKSIDDRDSLEETQYRRPSTFVKKPDPTSTRFGADIFSMMQSTLMPINEPNFDSSYILDFGDELELQLIGQKSSIVKLPIKRDGSISIEDLGKLYIAGLSIDEASNLIKNKVNESFIGIEAFVTLTNVRDIQIIMAGNVYNPGSYTLNGNSNIFHALSVSGGPSAQGSFRSIDLIRNNKKIDSIDLYQTFVYGKASFNKRLRSGDIVFVNSVKKVVIVNGSVNRPGEYELKEDEELSKAIFFSNGLSAKADQSNIKLDRILDGKIVRLPISNIRQFDNIEAYDGDRIFIRAYSFRSVDISGAVINPGLYLMNEGDSLLDVIEKSGGFLKSAYPFGLVYENIETKRINMEAANKLYDESVKNISKLLQDNGSTTDFTPIFKLLNDTKEAGISGRVIVDIKNASLQLIRDGDTIVVPESPIHIYLYGAISSNGAASFVEGESIDYYIQKQGGYSGNADLKSMYILHANGETSKININKSIFTSQSKAPEIYPGSVIFIPEKLNSGYSSMLRAQSYATILANLGVSLASISVLKD